MRLITSLSFELVRSTWSRTTKKLVIIAGLFTAASVVQAQVSLGNISKISAGIDTTCAITNGDITVQCWGKNHYQTEAAGPNSAMINAQYVPYAGTDVAEVAIGNDHTCTRTNTGAVACWGQNFYGQLGNGTTNGSSHRAVNVSGLSSGVISITAGLDHLCALTDTGAVKCWGRNQFGQLGINSTTNSLVPATVVGLEQGVIAIAARGNHSCALLNTGNVECWGSNNFNELGNGTFTSSPVPIEIQNLPNVQKITAGDNHNCALISDGTVKCWGANDKGQSGVNVELPYLLMPLEVQNLSNAIEISASGKRTCALVGNSAPLEGAAVKCWGSNLDNSGAQGPYTAPYSASAVEMAGWESGISAIAVGDYHTCVVNIEGNVSCAGWNQLGQLGDSTLTERVSPASAIQAMKPQISHLSTFNGEATVRFTPPANDSGSPITSYTVITIPAGGIDNQAGTLDSQYGHNELSHLITGLTNGTRYSFQVLATNALGTGLPSDSSYGTPAAVNCDWGNVLPGGTYTGTFASTDCTDSSWSSAYYTRRYIYNGRAGDQLALQMNMAGRINLLGISGIATTTPYRLPNSNSYFTLNYSGPYIIEVSSYTVGQTGNYSFSVLTPSTDSSSNSSSPSTSSAMSSVVLTSSSSSINSSTTTASSQPSTSSISTSSFSSSAFSSQAANCNQSLVQIGSTQNGTLAIGDCQTGQRGYNFYTDVYSFSAAAGQQIYLQINSSAFDTYVYLKNSSGTVIVYNDDSNGSTNSRVPGTSGYFTVPTSGTYFVEVSSYSSFSTGSYTLSLIANNSGVSSSSSSNSNSASSAAGGCGVAELSFFGVVNGALTASDCTQGTRGTSYYTDIYRFNADMGQQIYVQLNSTVFDTYLYLKDANGNLVASNDDSAGTSNSRIPINSGYFTLPTTGTYYIEVSSYNSFTTGAYSLGLVTLDSIGSSSQSSNASSLAAGCETTDLAFGTVTGNLAANDCTDGTRGSSYYTDRFSFTATAGQQISILLTSTAFDSYVYLKNTSGAVLISNDDGGGGTNSRIPASTGTYTTPDSGTYFIEVTSYSTLTTGSYNLQLN